MYEILINVGGGYGRVVSAQRDPHQKFHESPLEWGPGMPDAHPDRHGVACFPTREAAKKALGELFPERHIVTYDTGASQYTIHAVTMGAYRAGSYFGPHETYVEEFASRAEAEAFLTERRNRLAGR